MEQSHSHPVFLLWQRMARPVAGWVSAINRFMHRPRVRPWLIGFIGLTIVVVSAMAIALPRYELVVNRSESLPGVLFLLDKNRPPHCGDTTAFDMPVTARFYRGYRLIKILRGCPGDRIEVRQDRSVWVGGRSVGFWQEFSQQGHHQLYPISPGVIPEGKVYLYATHPRSYDSRYRSFGLRDRSELLGTVTRIF